MNLILHIFFQINVDNLFIPLLHAFFNDFFNVIFQLFTYLNSFLIFNF